MANIAGYRAVVEAAHEFGSFFTGQVTAAGKVPPAKVLVVGRRRGRAGRDRHGAASLGAIVRATDAAPRGRRAGRVAWAREFLARRRSSEAGASRPTATPRRRARTSTAEAAELYAAQAADVDIIITTALIPGAPAPRLITADDGRPR